MTHVGFSTGALAHADFRKGLRMSRGKGLDAIEVSALRSVEVQPLLDAVDSLDLVGYEYVSFHAPSSYPQNDESELAREIFERLPTSWPVVLHPDSSADLSLWAPFGRRLLIENMDKRKSGARTAEELEPVFAALPLASFCFDIGHARQIDPTMLEGYRLLRQYGDRLREIHISEVNTASRHERLSYAAVLAFRELSWLVRQHSDVAVILETPVEEHEMRQQADMALEALGLHALQSA